MKVILKRDVKGLGHAGDVKEVKNGYARNLLFPTGAAALADAGALANWERHRGDREAREAGLRAEAEATAERLRGLKLEVAVKAGEKNRLFGSVTNREIADLIAREGIEIDRHDIHLRQPIKMLGDFKVDVHVMPGISAEMTVSEDPVAGFARRWADVWRRAWEAGEVDPIVALYHPDVVFSTQPFRVPYRGQAGVREYVVQAFSEEESPSVWVGSPVVGDGRAAVEWWAALTENGVPITLAGTSVLVFDADGLVIEQRDTWNQAKGLHQPPPGWGG